MLHEKDSYKMNKSISMLLPALLKTVSDSADEVVLLNLQILASISSNKKEFLMVLNSLVILFLEDRVLLETRGALVIRKLCVLLNCKNIYLCLADILNKNNFNNFEFVSFMVQTLNLILMTAPELIELRKSLKNCFNKNYRLKYPLLTLSQKLVKNSKNINSYSTNNNNYENIDNENENNNENSNENNNENNDENNNENNENENDNINLFISLFYCWSNNPVATFSLCLLSQAYDLSAKLILKFAEVDITVGFLMQIDKLVQLIESPVFIHLRLQLLEVSTVHHGDLLKSMYGLLMVRSSFSRML